MSKQHDLHLTRGALYILEACMQDPGPCNSPNKTVLWAKIWDKVRKANNRLIKLPWAPQGIDVEKKYFKEAGEDDISFGKRQVEMDDAFKAWQEEPVTLTLNDKYRDACREALKFITTQKDKARTKLENTLHSATLLIELGLATEEDEESDSDSAEEKVA